MSLPFNYRNWVKRPSKYVFTMSFYFYLNSGYIRTLPTEIEGCQFFDLRRWYEDDDDGNSNDDYYGDDHDDHDMMMMMLIVMIMVVMVMDIPKSSTHEHFLQLGRL